MCGIVGYIGRGNCVPLLVEGLKRLEYRGYDSIGVAVLNGSGLKVVKRKGKMARVEPEIRALPSSGLGIGHNRWATHGAPSDVNAHPHLSADGKIAIVHNGIIENYEDLKRELEGQGVVFVSQTDSEVVAQLTSQLMKQEKLSFDEAVKRCLRRLQGTYGLLFIHSDHPSMLIGARNGSPLCFGVGEGEIIVSSDVVAFATHFSKVVHLEDHEMVIISDGGYQTRHLERGAISKELEAIDVQQRDVNKGGHPHFMLKEIFEQPESLARAMSGRLLPEEGNCKLGGIHMDVREFLDIDQVCFIGCGTSYHAGLAGVYLMERLARISCSSDVAPELKYRNPIVRKNTLYVGISQSGETADTITALKEIKNKGGHVIGICNVVGSSMARLLGRGIYIHAGPEISVCSTKAFTSQLAAITMLTILLARSRDLSQERGIRLVEDFAAIPDLVRRVLKNAAAVERVAKKSKHFERYLYMGRGLNYPVALEGALKMKEVAYVFAEGYSSAEMKHGAIALVDGKTMSVFVCPDDGLKAKNLSNMQEVKARGGPIIAVATEGDEEVRKGADEVFYIPRCDPELTPFLSVIYLQLLSYYVARELGRDIDQPRNLAKSVTVE